MARRRRSSRKKTSSTLTALLKAVFVLLLLAGCAVGWLLLMPYGPSTETFVELAPGSSALRIGEQLEDAGVIRSQIAFDLMRWTRRGKLKAGEYRFDHPASVIEVYARIRRGDIYTKTVTIPEGSSSFDIAARLEQAGFGEKKDFLEETVKQTGLIADLDPDARSVEGYLFPDTYHFPRKFTDAQIIATMVRRFRAVATQAGLKEKVHRVVTLASLVERETGLDAERPLVASVFENRLAKKIPLMTDPSVIYGLEVDGRWRGTIYESDLKFNTPYNTYLHAGLPPGPVANPGLKSLRAAMEPARSNYLYFVAAGADPQGGSRFSSTIDEHIKNVAEYRRAIKKAGVQ